MQCALDQEVTPHQRRGSTTGRKVKQRRRRIFIYIQHTSIHITHTCKYCRHSFIIQPKKIQGNECSDKGSQRKASIKRKHNESSNILKRGIKEGGYLGKKRRLSTKIDHFRNLNLFSEKQLCGAIVISHWTKADERVTWFQVRGSRIVCLSSI